MIRLQQIVNEGRRAAIGERGCDASLDCARMQIALSTVGGAGCESGMWVGEEGREGVQYEGGGAGGYKPRERSNTGERGTMPPQDATVTTGRSFDFGSSSVAALSVGHHVGALRDCDGWPWKDGCGPREVGAGRNCEGGPWKDGYKPRYVDGYQPSIDCYQPSQPDERRRKRGPEMEQRRRAGPPGRPGASIV